MTEPLRNMIGFMTVSAMFGIAGLLLKWKARRRRPSLWAWLGSTGGFALLGGAVFFAAWFVELPAAYIFTVLRMPGAVSVKGVPVSKIIAGNGGHWVTDDYFAGLCGNHVFLTAMRLETPFNSTDYYFAYDSRTRVVVPMTDAAAQMFPELMPPGDNLEGVGKLNGETSTTWMSGDEIKLPAQWFRTVTRATPSSG